jgi:uncharacterized repeat protein (TIGR01451 family)
LSGLAANTLYHYRVAASSAVGTSYGGDATFATGPDLTVTKTSAGAMTQGQAGEFTVTVANEGGGSSSGTVSVTEEPPAGMTVISMSGSGWTFDPNNLKVSRSDALAAAASYPPITVSVSLAADAAATLTNSATVFGGNDVNGDNNVATRVVTVARGSSTIETWREIHFGSAANSGAGADTNVLTLDGLPNLVKYAFGLNPNQVASENEQPRSGNFPPLAVTFRRARDASDVVIAVQATPDLAGTWTNIWSSTTNAFSGGTNEFETITVEDTAPIDEVQSGRFLRINVTRPE